MTDLWIWSARVQHFSAFIISLNSICAFKLWFLSLTFYSLTGNGKSHYIKTEISNLCIPHATFPINESFSAQKCIEKLNEFAEGKSFAIHLNFTLPFLKVRLDLRHVHIGQRL